MHAYEPESMTRTTLGVDNIEKAALEISSS
jgi:hypothetical protein